MTKSQSAARNPGPRDAFERLAGFTDRVINPPEDNAVALRR
jgi:hypothetical protein